MDVKITKNRLKNFFVYDGIKTLIFSIIIALVVVFIFNFFGVEPTEGQTVYFMYGYDVKQGSGASQRVNECLESEDYSFSYDVLKVDFCNATSAGQYSALYMAQTYHETDQGDIVICSNVGESEESDSVFYRLATMYYIEELNYFSGEAIEYASKFYDGDELNMAKVEDYFRKRMKKDKRYKTEKQIKEGISLEAKRIESVKTNGETLKKLLAEHPEIFAECDISGHNGVFGLNLGVLTGGEKNVIDDYYRIATDDEGKGYYTSDGLMLCLGRYDEQTDLRYESIAYMLHLIKTYTNLL